MKNTLLTLLALLMFSGAALSQNAKISKTLDEKGPNGGEVQVYDEKYSIEMKRNAGTIELYVSDEQKNALTAENSLSGAVVVNYNDKTEENFVIESGLDLSNLQIDANKEIYMVMLYAMHNGETFEARYYLKEGQMWKDYDKRMEEHKKREMKDVE
ncbi:MAG: hypothetical protein HKO56_04385 [Bacteroidia bacterium]|nr:hypothetical protein [Bacteroidia bacterium]NNC85839.1 hypothetical protein [Bacteroidia bacterium]NNM15876.1 hypothetical protein [Bacteroidia bacterium]